MMNKRTIEKKMKVNLYYPPLPSNYTKSTGEDLKALLPRYKKTLKDMPEHKQVSLYFYETKAKAEEAAYGAKAKLPLWPHRKVTRARTTTGFGKGWVLIVCR